MNGIGQYRSRGKDDESHTAFVNDRSISFDIGERLYRSRGYTPEFDQLPWVEIGEARPARQSMGHKPKSKSTGAMSDSGTDRPGYGEGTFDQNKRSNAADVGIDGS